jgi:hypothetical protein
VVTLVLALMLMGGWQRSQYIFDFIEWQSGTHSTEVILSVDRCFMWQNRQLKAPESQKRFRYWYKAPFESLDAPNSVFQWRWRRHGFGVVDWTVQPPNVSRTTMWVVPYWSIVGPLTLISAYLLLSKPRSSTSKKIDEPIDGMRF